MCYKGKVRREKRLPMETVKEKRVRFLEGERYCLGGEEKKERGIQVILGKIRIQGGKKE